MGDATGPAHTAEPPYGAVLAGGESSRYGAPKALATVGGERIIDRVVAALREVVPDVILSANEPALFRDLELPTYPDEGGAQGPLAGIYTALRQAAAAGRPGILAVACDMPVPSVPLLVALRDRAFGSAQAPDIVIPGSAGPRGVEPLFAAYSVGCIPAIDGALADGDRRMIGFHDRVSVRTIPLREVRELCDPAVAFMNVNTPEDRARAEAVVARRERRG